MSDKPQIPSGFYFQIFENSSDAIFLLDQDRIIECNSAALRLLAYSKEVIVGRSYADFSAPGQTFPELDGRSRDFGWTFLTSSGNRISASVFASLCHTERSDLTQIVVQESAKRNSEEILAENAYSELILDIFPGLFFIYDITEGFENARLVRYNNKWYREKLGYRKGDIPDAYPFFFFSPDDAGKTAGVIEELKKTKYSDFEINIRHYAGFDIPYLFVVNILENESKVFFAGVGIDISERKYTEFALKQSEEYFKNIFNSSSDGIMVLDLDMKILNANNAMLRMFDYKFEDIAFQNILDFVPDSVRKLMFERSLQIAKNVTLPPLEIDAKKRSGELIPIEINSIMIRYGERVGILATIRDLTERKMLEKQIFNSEILSEERERERFSKELHDGLGPILSTCKIYLHSLNEMLARDSELLKISDRALTLLDDALVSIKEISNNLSPHVLRNFGLVQAIIAFTHNLENISDLKFEVHYNYDERLNEIIEFTAYRIITELINNSIKYAEASLVLIELNLKMPYLYVSYKDNGKGFDFANTRNYKRGFGLSNIETRVDKFNGSYNYFSEPGKGVKVEFSLKINHSDK